MASVPLGKIQVGKRLRGLRENAVVELMDSIGQLGLQTPITVAAGIRRREGGGMDTGIYHLIAGHHRLEACRRLGWEEIEAAVVQLTEPERRLWEIDENLCRADLSELERGEHLAERKRVYEALHPETRHGGDRGNQYTGGKRQDLPLATFASDTAEKTGASDRSVRQSIRRAEKIDPKVRDRIRDNPEIADSGVELDALAGMDSAQQRRAVALVEAGQAVGVRDAKRLMEPKPQKVLPHFKEAEVARQKRRDAFVRAWNALDDDDREWARAHIDEPLADNITALRTAR